MNEQFFQRIFWGLLIAALGVGFLLRQAGLLDFDIGEAISLFWPAILIVFGLQNMAVGRRYGSGAATWGIIMTLVGFVFLGRNLGWFDWSIGDIISYLWPVALIVFGLSMMLKPKRKKPHDGDEGWKAFPHTTYAPPRPPVPPAPPLHPNPLDPQPEHQPVPPAPEFNKPRQGEPPGTGAAGRDANEGGNRYERRDYRDYKRDLRERSRHRHGCARVEWWNHDPKALTRSGFIGDIHLGHDHWELKPMNISHFIGDTVLDLTKAQIPYGETKIAISSFIGDVKVFIPNDYEVGVQVVSSAFLGDATVLEQREGGLFKNMNVETPYYYDTDKKIRLIVSTFIGDVRVTKVG
ncbi:MAG TPA: cell wall-active antibiotics response protein LiaF [Paenibacillus sp.]|uniref:cell wall-active antibiotics response protein LiaF n=1 Tax=Paenibacillus sp. TaxID=58172 RepID=UPI0028D4C66E|nr:cell wall-active antibiotics response protein LiaF [Paenibacillus sp.]HUC92509.1 cell wall-active antibiotics response protein LiaF [Paenibacillus sp.]